MNKYLTVKVTEEDIRFGAKGSPEGCPIARAASRVTNKQCSIAITLTVGLREDNPIYPIYYEQNKRARNWYRKFDNSRHVSPTTFRFKLRTGII